MISLNGNGYYLSSSEAQDLFFAFRKLTDNKDFLRQCYCTVGNIELADRVFAMLDCMNDGAAVRKTIMPKDQYIMVEIDGESIAEHRYVYYKATHPFLTDKEIISLAHKKYEEGKVIHHIDGDRHNNDIFNLVELADNSEHRKCHSYLYRSPAERMWLLEKTVRKIGIAYIGTPIDELEVSFRLANCLSCAGYSTVKDIYKDGVSKLMKIRNFGERCLLELDKELMKLNLPSIKDESKKNIERINAILSESEDVA